MPFVESEFGLLRDPRLAAQLAEHATSPCPAWLWSSDGSRILWANAIGAAIFGHATRRFGGTDLATAQIIRLAGTLPSSGPARLERLRGFGAGFGRALTCVCLRAVLRDGGTAVLILATEPAGPSLTLQQRVGRLLAGQTQMVAAFAPDGALLAATEGAQVRLAGMTTLVALGIDALAREALADGRASGATPAGPVTVERLGRETSRVLVVSFAPPSPGKTGSPQATLTQSEPAPAAPAFVAEAPALTPSPTPVQPPPPSPAPALRAPAAAEVTSERRHPLRFVWQMDVDGRFLLGSDEFIALVGPRTTAAFGRLWSEVAAALKLDPENQIARAVATRETWSGIVLSWPVDESSERLPVELSGLPVFDRDRTFRGYRGFGVCRDLARINQLIRERREHPIGFMTRAEVPAESETAAVLASPPEPASAAAAVPEAPAAPEEATGEAAAPEAAVPEVAASAAAAVAPERAASAAPITPVAPVAAEEAPLSEQSAAAVGAAPAANVVPFRPTPPNEPKGPSLSPVEHSAFRELAQELTARLRGGEETPAPATESEEPTAAPPAVPAEPAPAQSTPAPIEAVAAASAEDAQQQALALFEPLLDRIPVGVLIYRHDTLLYGNRRFFEWSGYDTLDALAAAGGLSTLLVEPGASALADGGTQSLSIMTRSGALLPIEGRLFTLPWAGAAALALVLTSGQTEKERKTALALDAAEDEIRELQAMLDTAADAALVLNGDGRIVAAGGGVEALFGRPPNELDGRFLSEVLGPESERPVREFIDRVAQHGATPANARFDGILNVSVRSGEGKLRPLAMTLMRLGGDRFGILLRDITAVKKIEEDMRAAQREAQHAAAAKSEFMAKVSHEIRTPLNTMTGFAEVIMAERFGPIGNERYRDYLKDILAAGMHLVALLNDLLDLSKIETGQLKLNFANVSLNELTQQCVGIMQPQASRARIIIRTSLTPGLPRIVADERSLRQIVLNLLSNSIRFTGPGGQVIVSTAFADSGEAVLRVRDTGVGMSEKDVTAALEPFRQTATSASWGSGGTGLGLPLTKALAEANRAHFSIKSAPNAGTLVEVAFPPTRLVAN